ncbi:hypothetical protein AKJ57_04290 [candidate division MSBL1 archaeon SCGC-AAA259A05]|uniref:Uncharacterized protein n=1 Tax=candidate division MSBL1 archaeon SCGC-AAA259A05 TaxID=1698259 RepID=A0A133U7T6_9EURY|nr:hypothetical protein AKJ57_04290 [candidate division MSBL1 archaeon SCGC-AAA259A05]
MSDEKKSTVNKERILKDLKNLPPEERKEILDQIKPEKELPILYWTTNPITAKLTFKFLQNQGEATLEEIREFLQNQGAIRANKGEYNFGVIPRDGDLFFNIDGSWGENCKVSLTETGKKFAEIFRKDKEMTSLERSLLIGIQPYGSGFVYLSILEKNREKGVLREDMQKELVNLYGNKGKYFTGYFTTWFSRIGLIKKEKDGRKVRYKPTFPTAW